MIALALAGCGSNDEDAPLPEASEPDSVQTSAARIEADLAACPEAEPAPDRIRTQPIAVAGQFRGTAKSDLMTAHAGLIRTRQAVY